MKIEVNEKRQIVLKEVYNGILIETKHNELMGISMRDTGFEFNYNGTWFEAKRGIVKPMASADREKFVDENKHGQQ